jgi:hypothetical protein
MTEASIRTRLQKKGADLKTIAGTVVLQPALLSVLFKGLASENPRTRYGSMKVLRTISEKDPAILASRLGRFIGLLDSDNTILRWGAIQIVANLAAVDSRKRIEKIFDKYFAPIRGPVMVTAGTIIGGAPKIALAYPELADRIAQEILRAERATYQTPECRNIALGHAITALDQFFDSLQGKQRVIAMVTRQLHNPRNATRKKAERFLQNRALNIA